MLFQDLICARVCVYPMYVHSIGFTYFASRKASADSSDIETHYFMEYRNASNLSPARQNHIIGPDSSTDASK